MSLVILRVFRLGPRALGAFHSELEVYGKGYSFMGGGEGIYETNPYKRSQEPCKAVLRLGYTNLTPWEVENLVNFMRDTHWGPTDYHPLSHNCNCFCKQLAKIFGGQCAPLLGQQGWSVGCPLGPQVYRGLWCCHVGQRGLVLGKCVVRSSLPFGLAVDLCP